MKSLKIALIGYGRMGRIIEEIALSRGHQVVATIDSKDSPLWQSSTLATADIAIEFTSPSVAASNCSTLLDMGIPVVSGTTGWNDELTSLIERVKTDHSLSFFWASNFSIGVNLFFALNRQLARVMNSIMEYHVSIEETHHKHKLDAPSGTAITLAEEIIEEMPEKYKGWALTPNSASIEENILPISSTRLGEVPGIHTARYTSPVDVIELKHEAFGRQGFALGALMAAEFLAERKGFYTMQDMMALFIKKSC